MDDKRVVFDFELTFSNGGGLRGQDFRLDVESEMISDDALANFIIADLRLLMVGEVKILNKRVISERHKRSTEPSSSPGNVEDNLIDLSHSIENGMVTYKGLPAPVICDYLTREKSRSMYAQGTEFQIGRIDMVSNTGTYLDTPFHRYADGYDLSGLPLDRVSGLAGIVVRLTGLDDRAIDWTNFAASNIQGRAVLVHTGWDQHWRTEQYFEGHPFLTEKAAEYLRDHGALLVGIDSFNIDDTDDGRRPVHSVLLRAGIPIVEHMTNLSALPTEGFLFSAVPPKVSGMGTFPVRAHARIVSPK